MPWITALGVSSRVSTKNINLKILSELKVIVPEKKLQDKFAKFVEKVENQKTIIQRSLDKLEMLKKSLMQEYFG